VLEAANSSVVWWDGPALCVPDPALRVLPGITVALVRRRAARCGIAVHHRRGRMSDLAGREVWLTNALHGIRPVVAWVGSTVPVGSPARAERWRQWWADCGEPLPEPSAGRAQWRGVDTSRQSG
jgi:branched-subunit amino acid aminotransferase/4-amino-4-deoxychorismate lyase